jgi:hypothetical protein
MFKLKVWPVMAVGFGRVLPPWRPLLSQRLCLPFVTLCNFEVAININSNLSGALHLSTVSMS